MKQKWNARNSYNYVATATKIRFHFQFPRLSVAAFGGHIGWLFNWKCKFSCRIISNIANYVKYNYLFETASIMQRCDFINSQISAQDTLGVANDDMYHILVTVETLYNTVNFCWNTHKRHSIARPKGRGMGCLLWVQRATYCVDLSILSSIKYLL